MTEPLTGLNDLLGDAIEAAANALSGTPLFDARWTQAKTVIDAAYPIIAAAVRADERAKYEDLRAVVEAQAGALDAMRLSKYRDNPEWLRLNMRGVADKLRAALNEPTP